MADPVLFYGGEFGYPFSNFASFGVTWRGRFAMTSEHHYQAAKFTDEDIINEIYAVTSAYSALKLARKYEALGKVRPDWTDEEKIAVMYNIISHKLDQHEYIQRKLTQSIGRELIEDSPTDSFWGRGPDWKGQNWLGKLWMRLRDERCLV